jgi:hypothetical protein
MPGTDAQTGYAPVDDLNMYYEIHGRGRPLILLHGAYMTIDMMGPILPGLAKTRQVITVEQQGHRHTADIDRPVTYETPWRESSSSHRPPSPAMACIPQRSRCSRRSHPSSSPELRSRRHIFGPRLTPVPPQAGREAHATRHDVLRLAGAGHPGDRRANPDRPGRLRRHPPRTTHFVPPGFGLLDRAEWLLAMIRPFLDAPLPEDL